MPVVVLSLAGCTKSPDSYAYANNSDYVIEIIDDSEFRFKWGDSGTSGTYKINDGVYTFKDESTPIRVNLTGLLDGNQLLVSGDVLMINLDGTVSEASLADLDDAIFIKQDTSNDIPHLAGTSWQAMSLSGAEKNVLPGSYDLAFFECGTGELGDWFYGIKPMTHTVKGNQIMINVTDSDISGTGKYKNGKLTVHFGNIKATYEQRSGQ